MSILSMNGDVDTATEVPWGALQQQLKKSVAQVNGWLTTILITGNTTITPALGLPYGALRLGSAIEGCGTAVEHPW